jgi:AcrR family transcriptional regulator
MATRLKADARRSLILEAAARVFGEHGFEATRMDDVADEAGVAKALLYKHFPSKDALFEALLTQQGDDFATALTDVLASAGTLDPVVLLTRGFKLWVDQVNSPEGRYNFADPGVHDAYDELRERIRAEIAAIIHAVEPSAEEHRNWLIAAAVQGAAELMVIAWADKPGQITADELVELLARFCWEGLAGLQTAFRAGEI